MSKGILIVPVEVVSSGGGCGSLIFFGILFYLIASTMWADRPQNDHINYGSSDPNAVRVQAVPVIQLNAESPTVRTLDSFPRTNYYMWNDVWVVNRTAGLLAVEPDPRIGPEMIMVYNFNGQIALITDLDRQDGNRIEGLYPRSIRYKRDNHDTTITSQSYTNLDHTQVLATLLPSYRIEAGVGSYRIWVNALDRPRVNSCIVETDDISGINRFSRYNADLNINETGHFAVAGDDAGDSLLLWDFNCNLILRYNTSGEIQSFVVTREGGILFSESYLYENEGGGRVVGEYFIRYIPPQ